MICQNSRVLPLPERAGALLLLLSPAWGLADKAGRRQKQRNPVLRSKIAPGFPARKSSPSKRLANVSHAPQ